MVLSYCKQAYKVWKNYLPFQCVDTIASLYNLQIIWENDNMINIKLVYIGSDMCSVYIRLHSYFIYHLSLICHLSSTYPAILLITQKNLRWHWGMKRCDRSLKKLSEESFPFTHLKSIRQVRLAIWDDEKIMNVKKYFNHFWMYI